MWKGQAGVADGALSHRHMRKCQHQLIAHDAPRSPPLYPITITITTSTRDWRRRPPHPNILIGKVVVVLVLGVDVDRGQDSLRVMSPSIVLAGRELERVGAILGFFRGRGWEENGGEARGDVWELAEGCCALYWQQDQVDHESTRRASLVRLLLLLLPGAVGRVVAGAGVALCEAVVCDVRGAARKAVGKAEPARLSALETKGSVREVGKGA